VIASAPTTVAPSSTLDSILDSAQHTVSVPTTDPVATKAFAVATPQDDVISSFGGRTLHYLDMEQVCKNDGSNSNSNNNHRRSAATVKIQMRKDTGINELFDMCKNHPCGLQDSQFFDLIEKAIFNEFEFR